jgi:phosphonate C-P lyase system protein PhnL
MVTAAPRRILAVRARSLGYVSQFLRVIPRVPALEVVAEPLRALGVAREAALERARRLLSRLGISERLWGLSPVTFSGGEQQRVNIARGLIAGHPVLLLDEPTASLDARSRAVVAELLGEARERGAAILGTFHVRAAAILGFVGAGGIGMELYLVIRQFIYPDISALVLLLVVTVAMIDVACERVRHRVLGGAAA